MQAQRYDSMALPGGELLDFLRAGDAGQDVLDLDQLEWVLDEAVELEQQQQQEQANTAGASAPGSGAGQAAVARLSTAQAGPALPASFGAPHPQLAPPAPLLVKLEDSSSIEETTPMQGTVGANGSFHSLASQSVAAAAAAAAVAALQAAQPSPSGEDGAQSTHRSAPFMFGAAAPQQPQQQQQSHHQPNRSHGSQDNLTGGTMQGYGGDSGPASKKKRTRNAEQMEQNRQAQQKYRERKKAEHEQLQKALDQMAAQLAAMKALEAQAMMLRNQNQALTHTVDEQAARINELTFRVEAQAVELAEARRQAAEASSLTSTQQRMILDQHSKLQLQEEVMMALKGRLQHQMDEAFRGQDKKTVCQRLVAAVRQAIEGANNVEGLQESLSQLPDHVVTDICRAILHEVKLMWPELAARFQAVGLASGPPAHPAVCSAEVGCY